MPIDTLKKVLGLVASAFPTLAADGMAAALELEQTIEQVEASICGALTEVAKAQEGLAAVTRERDEWKTKALDTARLVAALRGLVSAVSAQLARGEDTAWREACETLKEFEP